MRPLNAAIALAVASTAACSFSLPSKQFLQDDAPPPRDAPPGPFDCVGKSPPMMIPDQIMISGFVKGAPDRDLLPGATVDGFQYPSNAPTFSVKTDSASSTQGSFNGISPTPGRPFGEYLRVAAATAPPSPAHVYYPTFLFPAGQVTGSVNVGEIDVYSDAAISDILVLLTKPPPAAPPTADMTNKGMIVVAVLDCLGIPIAGATVSTSIPAGAGGDVHYLGSDGLPSATATVTDGGTGAALILNVPEDMINIDALTPHGHLLNTVPGKKGAVVETEVLPGYP